MRDSLSAAPIGSAVCVIVPVVAVPVESMLVPPRYWQLYPGNGEIPVADAVVMRAVVAGA